MSDPVLPVLPSHQGKVRDTYAIPGRDNLMLLIATDRFSTHNVKHLSRIPGKGEQLAALTLGWKLKVFDRIGLKTHLIAWGRGLLDHLPPDWRGATPYRQAFVVEKHKVHPCEFVWRRYLAGSLYEAYRKGEDPYGLKLPPSLPKMHRFEEPIFTPTHKSEDDEPMPAAEGRALFPEATDLTRTAFLAIEAELAKVGVALIDSKFEAAGDVLVDEWGTGDCSRMALVSTIREGEDPPWLDKEIGRQFALANWAGGEKVPLTFAPDQVKAMQDGYSRAIELVLGTGLEDFQRDNLG